MQSRRAFFGSAATIGLGSAAGGALIFQGSVGAQNRRQVDPVFDELRKELRASLRAMRDQTGGEAARRLALTLRISAAHARSSGADDQLKRALRRGLQREGRDAVLFHEMDQAMLAAETKAIGVVLPPLVLAPDPALRGQVLDAMLESGFTPLLTSAAARFDRVSRVLDARAGTFRLIQDTDQKTEEQKKAEEEARRRAEEEAHAEMCRQMERELFTIEAGMIMACLFPFDGGWACALLSGSYIGYRLVMFWRDC
jgi:hypothetical protein